MNGAVGAVDGSFSTNRASSRAGTTAKTTRTVIPRPQLLTDPAIGRATSVVPLSEQGGYRFGIDKLAVSFILDGFDASFCGWKRTEKQFGDPDLPHRGEKYEYTKYIEGGSQVYVRVWWTDLRDPACYLSFNPSRVHDPYGTELAPVADLPALLRRVLYESVPELGLVPIFDMPVGPRWLMPDPMAQVDVREIHITRDFVGLRDTHPYVHAVMCSDQKNASVKKPYVNPKTGRLESITVGNKSGVVQVYDKHLESVAKKRERPAAPGTLRVEARLDGPWIKRFGLRTLDEVTPQAAESAFEELYDWTGVSRPVASATTVLGRISSATQIRSASRMELLGYVVAKSLGLPHGLKRPAVRRYDILLGTLGIPADDPLQPDSTRERRLDLGRGTESVRSRQRWLTRTPRDVRAN
jgi:hypothetical protein